METIISCRTGVFGSVENACRVLPTAGVRHAEVPPPRDGDYAALGRVAADHGITIASLATPLDLQSDTTVEAFLRVLDGAAQLGVGRTFVSAKAGADTPREQVVRRLQRLAEAAAQRGVTMCMETHPPLGTNGDTALRTLSEVDRPGLRFNFDTANIYYYNEGTDTVSELRKVAHLVGSVHIKDTDGGFRSGRFPPLGQGVVDFPGVFRLLGRVGFRGPYTLEIEGNLVSPLDAAGRLAFLVSCMEYLRRIGAAPATEPTDPGEAPDKDAG
ncbi:MAG: sugar phosphate isomerase/epimerase [Lentisphaeria bacterium]|nr:sugar phosphate isomerase/epimerase [Lentisphaeria bacterium]